MAFIGWLSRVLAIAVVALVPATLSAGDAAAGKSLYPVCGACHGPNGEGNQAMGGPALAGQSPWYLVRQMELFQDGGRGTAPGDVDGAQMAAMSKGPQLSSKAALENLAAYIDSLPKAAPPVTIAGDVARGEALFLPCAACHGASAEGNESLGGPRLAGQSDWYLIEQIAKYKQGKRGYAPSDHYGRQMAPMANVLVDDQAVLDVVAWINQRRQ